MCVCVASSCRYGISGRRGGGGAGAGGGGSLNRILVRFGLDVLTNVSYTDQIYFGTSLYNPCHIFECHIGFTKQEGNEEFRYPR